MSKLLKNMISKVVNESLSSLMQREPTKPPFELLEPPVKILPSGKWPSEYSITREVPIRISEGDASALGLANEDVEDVMDGDVYNGEVEFYLSFDPYYSGGSSKNTSGHPDMWSPGDPEEFIVEDYTVIGFFLVGTSNIAIVSQEDGIRLSEFLGDLSDDETQRMKEIFLSHSDDSSNEDYFDDRDEEF